MHSTLQRRPGSLLNGSMGIKYEIFNRLERLYQGGPDDTFELAGHPTGELPWALPSLSIVLAWWEAEQLDHADGHSQRKKEVTELLAKLATTIEPADSEDDAATTRCVAAAAVLSGIAFHHAGCASGAAVIAHHIPLRAPHQAPTRHVDSTARGEGEGEDDDDVDKYIVEGFSSPNNARFSKKECLSTSQVSTVSGNIREYLGPRCALQGMGIVVEEVCHWARLMEDAAPSVFRDFKHLIVSEHTGALHSGVSAHYHIPCQHQHEDGNYIPPASHMLYHAVLRLTSVLNRLLGDLYYSLHTSAAAARKMTQTTKKDGKQQNKKGPGPSKCDSSSAEGNKQQDKTKNNEVPSIVVPMQASQLLNDALVVAALSEPVARLLRSLLYSPRGLNFRNVIWHGFMGPGELCEMCPGAAYLLLWIVADVLLLVGCSVDASCGDAEGHLQRKKHPVRETTTTTTTSSCGTVDQAGQQQQQQQQQQQPPESTIKGSAAAAASNMPLTDFLFLERPRQQYRCDEPSPGFCFFLRRLKAFFACDGRSTTQGELLCQSVLRELAIAEDRLSRLCGQLTVAPYGYAASTTGGANSVGRSNFGTGVFTHTLEVALRWVLMTTQSDAESKASVEFSAMFHATWAHDLCLLLLPSLEQLLRVLHCAVDSHYQGGAVAKSGEKVQVASAVHKQQEGKEESQRPPVRSAGPVKCCEVDGSSFTAEGPIDTTTTASRVAASLSDVLKSSSSCEYFHFDSVAQDRRLFLTMTDLLSPTHPFSEALGASVEELLVGFATGRKAAVDANSVRKGVSGNSSSDGSRTTNGDQATMGSNPTIFTQLLWDLLLSDSGPLIRDGLAHGDIALLLVAATNHVPNVPNTDVRNTECSSRRPEGSSRRPVETSHGGGTIGGGSRPLDVPPQLEGGVESSWGGIPGDVACSLALLSATLVLAAERLLLSLPQYQQQQQVAVSEPTTESAPHRGTDGDEPCTATDVDGIVDEQSRYPTIVAMCRAALLTGVQPTRGEPLECSGNDGVASLSTMEDEATIASIKEVSDATKQGNNIFGCCYAGSVPHLRLIYPSFSPFVAALDAWIRTWEVINHDFFVLDEALAFAVACAECNQYDMVFTTSTGNYELVKRARVSLTESAGHGGTEGSRPNITTLPAPVAVGAGAQRSTTGIGIDGGDGGATAQGSPVVNSTTTNACWGLKEVLSVLSKGKQGKKTPQSAPGITVGDVRAAANDWAARLRSQHGWRRHQLPPAASTHECSYLPPKGSLADSTVTELERVAGIRNALLDASWVGGRGDGTDGHNKSFRCCCDAPAEVASGLTDSRRWAADVGPKVFNTVLQRTQLVQRVCCELREALALIMTQQADLSAKALQRVAKTKQRKVLGVIVATIPLLKVHVETILDVLFHITFSIESVILPPPLSQQRGQQGHGSQCHRHQVEAASITEPEPNSTISPPSTTTDVDKLLLVCVSLKDKLCSLAKGGEQAMFVVSAVPLLLELETTLLALKIGCGCCDSMN